MMDPRLVSLPNEVWSEIFSYLSEATVLRVCSLVCKAWNNHVKHAKLKLLSVVDPAVFAVERAREVSERWQFIVGLEYRGMPHLNTIAGVPLYLRLRDLDLGSSAIVVIEGLSRCPNLETLNLAHTQVKDISALRGCPALRLASFRTSMVADISSLGGCPSLASLDLQFTRVSDLSPLRNCGELRKLDLRGTPVDDISPLSGCAKLQTVDLSLTHVQDIDALAASSGYLVSLNLYRTPVRSLEPLAGFPELQKVFLQSCDHLRHVSPLTLCPKLAKVDLKATAVEDAEELKDLGLQFLRLPNGDIILTGEDQNWAQAI